MSRRKPLARRGSTGRIIAPKDNELLSPTGARRRMNMAAVGLKDCIWSTMAGHLFRRGKIAASEYAAAKRWCALTSDYSTACQSPHQPRSISPGGVVGGTPADVD